MPLPFDGDIKRLAPLPSSDESYCHRCGGGLDDDLGDTSLCACGHQPYRELHYLESNVGWQQMCNVCGFDTSIGHCPLHAPRDIPGLEPVICHAVPPHQPTWTVASDFRYENYCPWCLLDEERALHSVPEPHERHGRWRAWRVTRRVVRLLEMARVTAGHTFTAGGGCPGCVHRMGWRWTR